MKILAFGVSNSRNSINQQFALWAAAQQTQASVDTLQLDDFDLPIYSPHRETELGIPPQALDFLQRLREADGLIMSFAEHNGGFTAAWKNLSDWLSRVEREFLRDKPLILLSTSPGAGGGREALVQARKMALHTGGHLIDAIALPAFDQHFQPHPREIDHPEVTPRVRAAVQTLIATIAGSRTSEAA